MKLIDTHFNIFGDHNHLQQSFSLSKPESNILSFSYNKVGLKNEGNVFIPKLNFEQLKGPSPINLKKIGDENKFFV